ncbi:MAG: transposase [Spirochaetes bacterium]|nr:MAG: transposase [Spirochaetota bacterium]
MSIRQRAYPTPEQTEMLYTHIHHTRFVYNIAVAQRMMFDRQSRERQRVKDTDDPSKLRLNLRHQGHDLAELRQELPWLGEGSSAVQQSALRDVEKAFSNFFARRASYPHFKRRDDAKSFTVRDVSVRRLNRRFGVLTVPKAGSLRFRITRDWDDIRKAKSARVTLRNNCWNVSFTTDPPPRRETGDGVLGVDCGVAITLATSDRDMLHVPTLSGGERKRFVSLERELARKPKKKGEPDSANRTKTKHKLGRLQQRLTNRRKDFIEQMTTFFAESYEVAVLEKLQIANMTKRPKPKPDRVKTGQFLPNGAAAKSGLNRAILASCWGMFNQRLSDKMLVVKVSASYTSQQCHRCGHTAEENRKSQAEFCCQQCGLVDNADVNAAKTIRNRYLQQPRDTGDRVEAVATATVETNLQIV